MTRERTRHVIQLLASSTALALIVVLAIQKRDMQRQAVRFYNQAIQPHVGFFVPTLNGVTLTGDSVTVGAAPPGAKQILSVFTTTCGFCKSTLPAWQSIAAEFADGRSPHVAVIGISSDSLELTQAFVDSNKISFPVVRFPDTKLIRLYRAAAVPMTVVLDHEGKMLYVRRGVLNSKAAKDSVILAARDTGRSVPRARVTASK